MSFTTHLTLGVIVLAVFLFINMNAKWRCDELTVCPNLAAVFGQMVIQRSESDWILIAWGRYAEALFYQ